MVANDLPHKPLFSIDIQGLPIKQVGLTLLQSAIFPVVVKSESGIRSIGTCFAISNHGLCLTARHVIEDVDLSGQIDEKGNPTLAHDVGVLYINTERSDDIPDDHIFGGFIPINTAHLIGGTDIAVLHLNLPVHKSTGEFILMPALRLSLAMPQIDSEVFAFGYDQGSWSKPRDGVLELQHNFKITQGNVSQTYPIKRDSAVLPFPCFECSATFLSGMSGGPVFSENGLVIGVATSGFNFDDDQQAVSYAALLAPAMHINLLARNEDGSESPRFLWDFAEGGAINVERGDAKIERTDDYLSIRLGQVHFKSAIRS